MNSLKHPAPLTYSRSSWLQLSSMAVAALCAPDTLLAKFRNKTAYGYYLATVTALPFELPPGKKIPFDWPVAELPVTGNSIAFHWNRNIHPQSQNLRLRFTSATDVREYCMVELALAASKEIIGTINISYAHYMQPFEMTIPQNKVPLMLEQGIEIKLIQGTKPFWLFIQGINSREIPDAFLPHLLGDYGTKDHNAWKKTLLSLATLSMFGWMEGCVLDAIIMMAKENKQLTKLVQQRLDKYFANNTLVYESYNNERKTGTINSVESILPFAMLALQNPHHPMLQTAIDFCREFSDSAGVVADEKGANRRLKTEECYTVSYPMATLAKKLNRPDLQQMAIANLQARVNLLATPSFIYQNGKELEKPGFANWARGVAWFLLGLTKTLAILPNNEVTKPLHNALQQAAEMVISHQQANGLFFCFLHRPETGIETSGSAGIAAGLAYGYSKKLLPVSCRKAAEKCLQGLRNYYTPDGFLTGTAQVNKGGEALQANGFRVISPYTLGFIGVLETSLKN